MDNVSLSVTTRHPVTLSGQLASASILTHMSSCQTFPKETPWTPERDHTLQFRQSGSVSISRRSEQGPSPPYVPKCPLCTGLSSVIVSTVIKYFPDIIRPQEPKTLSNRSDAKSGTYTMAFALALMPYLLLWRNKLFVGG